MDDYTQDLYIRNLYDQYYMLIDIAESKGVFAPEWEMASDILDFINEEEEGGF